MPNEVIVEKHWAQFLIETHRAGERAIAAAGAIALEEVRRAGDHGYNIAPILGKASLTGVERTSRGTGIWVVIPDFREVFFEYGTYQRRRRPLKQGRRSTSTQKGVFGAYMLTRAVALAKKAIPELLKAEFEKISL